MDEAQKQQLHQAIENATVKILIGNTFKGTGFFISPDGYVLTAYHCIGVYPPEIWVETRFDGKYPAQLETDKSLLSDQYDIAVLQVFGYRPSHYVPLGLISRENINDAVVAIGYPANQYRLYEGRIGGVDELTLASDVIKGEGQSGGLVYHYRSQRVVGLASAIWKREVIVNEGLAVRFENLFKKWEELREINQQVATAWDQRLQRLRQGKQEVFKPSKSKEVSVKPSKPKEVKEVVVKPKTSWIRNLASLVRNLLENLFKKWEELREINQHVAMAWDQRLQRLRQGKPEAIKPNKPIEVKEVVVKPKTSRIRNLASLMKNLLVGSLVVVLGLVILNRALRQSVTVSHQPSSVTAPKTLEVQPLPSSKTTTVDSKQPGTVFQDQLKDGGLGPKMVVIPAGRFQMGDLQETGDSDEKPVHWVNVEKFALGQYEVTRGEFRQFVQATDYKTEAETSGGCYGWTGGMWELKAEFSWRNVGFAQKENHPVVCVSWNDATTYTQWLSQQIGRTYRLPTEAEWEYAVRAGTTTDYHFGNDVNQLGEYAWYSENSGGKTHPIGGKKPNAFGLYDMHGNVWEWCQDVWDRSYQGAPTDGSAWVPGRQQSTHVLRGGSWGSDTHYCRAAARYGSYDRGSHYGFRVVLR